MTSYVKRNKLLFILIFLSFIVFIFGILFYFLLDTSYKDIIDNNIDLLFQNKLIDFKSFFFNKLFSNIFIWLLGISVIGFIIVLILYLYKGFIFSFEVVSLLFNLNKNNFLMIIAYILPNLFFLCIMFVLSYYSISYSIFLFRFLFRDKKYNITDITRRYIKILLISFIITLLCCLLEYFILNHIGLLKL